MPSRMLARIGGFVLTMTLALGAVAAELIPYRAAYQLGLKGGVLPAGRVRGVVLVEWSESCEGWTVDQRMRLVVTANDGRELTNDLNFTSWESRDGKSFRFTLKSHGAMGADQTLAGDAVMPGPGRPGMARLSQPSSASIPLPPETIFPIQYTRRIIKGALAGATRDESIVFDGSSPDAPYRVNSVIGAAVRDPPRAATAPGVDARGLAVWPVSAAFYPVRKPGRDGLPAFEVGYLLRADGVPLTIDLDFGEIKLRGVLNRLDVLPRPKC